jgi:hypothetical protein
MMSYEQSTAAGMHDLLDKLRLFLITDGWTVNEWSSDSQTYAGYAGLTASGSKRLHVEKDLGPTGDVMTCFFNFRSAERLFLFEDIYPSGLGINNRYYGETRGIGINGSTGYDASTAGSNWDKMNSAQLLLHIGSSRWVTAFMLWQQRHVRDSISTWLSVAWLAKGAILVVCTILPRIMDTIRWQPIGVVLVGGLLIVSHTLQLLGDRIPPEVLPYI